MEYNEDKDDQRLDILESKSYKSVRETQMNQDN